MTAMIDPYTDLRHPRIDPGAPLASAVANERAILQRLRDRHPSAPDDWATWENTMRIRHGDEPRRRQTKHKMTYPLAEAAAALCTTRLRVTVENAWMAATPEASIITTPTIVTIEAAPTRISNLHIEDMRMSGWADVEG